VARKLCIDCSHVGYVQRVTQRRSREVRFLRDTVPCTDALDLINLEAKTRKRMLSPRIRSFIPRSLS
jgi:hypothetical protein